MGNDEVASPTKSDKASSPVQVQPTIHPYPEWAAVQGYYGPGVALPPPYLNSAVASGHAPPPYVWGPQAFMPPYGMPCTAMYTPGAYAHPPVPLGSHSQGQGTVPSPSINEAVVIATPLGTGPHAKSSRNKDRGLLKELKGLDGLPMSRGSVHGQSQSRESSEEGSSDGSDENYEPGDYRIQRRVASEDNLISGKHVGTRSSSRLALGMESKVSANGEVKASTALIPANDVPAELRRQDERTLKREKRKQSNRESARRSRLRNLAETEELAVRVDTLGTENMTLRTEVMQLKELSEKLRLENTTLVEKLKNAQLSQAEESTPERVMSQGLQNVSTENLLSRLNDSNSFGGGGKEADTPENSSGKLHQLLGPSSRTDSVAAS